MKGKPQGGTGAIECDGGSSSSSSRKLLCRREGKSALAEEGSDECVAEWRECCDAKGQKGDEK